MSAIKVDISVQLSPNIETIRSEIRSLNNVPIKLKITADTSDVATAIQSLQKKAVKIKIDPTTNQKKDTSAGIKTQIKSVSNLQKEANKAAKQIARLQDNVKKSAQTGKINSSQENKLLASLRAAESQLRSFDATAQGAGKKLQSILNATSQSKANLSGQEANLKTVNQLIDKYERLKTLINSDAVTGKLPDAKATSIVSNIDAEISKLKKLGSQAEITKQQISQANASYSNINNDKNVQKSATDAITKQIKQFQQLQQKVNAAAASNKIQPESRSNLNSWISDQITGLKQLTQQETISAESVQHFAQTYEEALSDLSDNKNTTTAIHNAEKLQRRFEALQDAWNSIKQDGIKDSSLSAAQEIDSMFSALGGNVDTKSLDDLQRKISLVQTKATSAGKLNSGVLSSLTAKTKELGMYLASSMTFQYAMDGVKAIVRNVRELDTAMTELKKTTNGSTADYQKFMQTSAQTAQEVGSKVSDVIQSAASWSRSGYGLQESGDLARASMIYTNVSEYENVEDATTSLIATMKAYGIEASNVMSVMDKLNAVGNTTATSSSGLGDALLRSGSALATAGNDLDQSLALITAANTSVQNPEKIGNGLKTISLRIRNTKGELEELGEESDGAVESITKLQTQLLNETGGKVNIFDSEGQFRTTYDILQDLAGVWQNLDSVAQANITTMLAGATQANVFNSLMSNMGIATQAYTTSLHAEGSALQENARYMDSIDGRMAQLSSTFQVLSSNLISSDFVKGTVSSLQSALEVINSIVEQFGSGALIAGIGALTAGTKSFASAWKDAAADDVLSGNVFDDIQYVTKKGFPNFTAMVKGIYEAEGATAKLSATWSGLGGIIGAHPIIAGITAITTAVALMAAAIDAAHLSFDEAAEKSAEARSTYESTVSEAQSLNDQITENKQRIAEIESQSKISSADYGEIASLKQENAQLQTQYQIKKQLANIQQKQAAEAANTALSTTEAVYMDNYTAQEGHLAANDYGYQHLDYIDQARQKQAELNSKQQEYNKLQEEQSRLASKKNLSDSEEKQYLENESRLNKYRSDIESLTADLSEMMSNVSTQYSSLLDENGQPLPGFEETARRCAALINSMDTTTSTAEKAENALNSFFNGSAGSNAIQSQILEMVKGGQTAEQAIKMLGLSLEDLGLDSSQTSYLNQYFKDLAESATEAKEAVEKVDGTISGIEAAKESKNEGTDYTAMRDYLEEAKELYDQGLTNTDDFKTVAELISPGIDSSAKAFKENYDKLQKYFTVDDDGNLTRSGIDRFISDLDSIVEKTGKDFESTADAAEQLGISAEAFDLILGRAHDYGDYKDAYSDLFDTAKAASEAQTALSGLQEIYAGLDAGANKGYLGLNLSQWQAQIDAVDGDLSKLPKEVLIEILTEYDLQQTQAEIEKIEQSFANGAKKTNTNMAELLGFKLDLRDKLEEQTQINAIEVPVEYKAASDKISSLQSELRNNDNLTSEQRLSIQVEIDNIADAQNDMLRAFQNCHPEITPETDAATVQATWDNWLNKEDGLVYQARVEAATDQAEKALSDLQDETVSDKEMSINANDNASSTIEDVDGKTLRDKIVNLQGGETAEVDAIVDHWNSLSVEDKKVKLEANGGDEAVAALDAWNNKDAEDKTAKVEVESDTDGADKIWQFLSGLMGSAVKIDTELDDDPAEQIAEATEGEHTVEIEPTIANTEAVSEDIQTAVQSEPVELTVEADTSGAQADLEATLMLINNSEQNKINLGFEADDTIEEMMSKVQSGEVQIPAELMLTDDSAISELTSGQTAELNANVNVNGDVDELHQAGDAVNSFPAESKTANVDVNADTSDIQAVEMAMNNVKDKDASVNIHANASEIQEAESAISNVDSKDINVTASADASQVSQVESAVNSLPSSKAVDVNVSVPNVGAISTLRTAIAGLVSKTVSVAASVAGTPLVAALRSAIASLKGKTVKVVAKVQGTASVRALRSAINGVKSKKVEIRANTFGTTSVRQMAAAIAGVKSKTVTITVRTAFGGGTGVNGLGAVNGTAYTNGLNDTIPGTDVKRKTKGAPTSGLALTGELGAEMLVRNGRYYLLGKDGTQFFNYRKNDIIYNAEQTKKLLRDGKLSSGLTRGHVYGGGKYQYPTGSAHIDGTLYGRAFADGSDTPDPTDFVEILLDRIERTLDRIQNAAENAYKIFTTRNNSYNEAIKQLSSNISKYKSAYDTYMSKANSVNLSSDIKTKIQNGSLNITEYNEEQTKLIQKYQDWYEKALDAQDSYIESMIDLSDLYKDKFEAISDRYGAEMDQLDMDVDVYNAYLDLLEAQGYTGSEKLYNEIIALEKRKQTKLQTEYYALQEQLESAVRSGAVEQWSEEWWEMFQAVEECSAAWQESTTEVAELQQKINELKWDRFDDLQDQISQITSEADFLIDLLENSDLYTDTGSLTNEGMSTVGLHGVNYNTYMAQAEQYSKAIKELNNQLKSDPHNNNLLERRNDLVEAQQKSILAAEKEKNAIKDLITKGYEAEEKSLDNLIDKFIDALDAAKDLYDYQQKISGYTDDIASIQKQLSAYSGDTSEEAQATIQKLKADLEEANSDLNDAEYDHYVSETKKLLQSLSDEFEALYSEKSDNIEFLISDVISQVNSNATTISDTLDRVTSAVGYDMTTQMDAIWDTSAGKITNVIAEYGNAFASAQTTTNSVLNNLLIAMNAAIAQSEQVHDTMADPRDAVWNKSEIFINQKDGIVSGSLSGSFKKDIVSSPSSSSSSHSSSSTSGGSANSSSSASPSPSPSSPPSVSAATNIFVAKKYKGNKSTLNKENSIVDRLSYFDFDNSKAQRANYWKKMGFSGAYTGSAAQNTKMLQKMKQMGYSSGGFVADMQKIAFDNGDDIVTVNTLKRGEAILTPVQASQFEAFIHALPQFNDLTENFKTQVPTAANMDLTSVGDLNQHIEINIPIDHVDDFNDFMNKMKDNREAQKLIQAMTVDLIAGKNSMRKNTFSFKQ